MLGRQASVRRTVAHMLDSSWETDARQSEFWANTSAAPRSLWLQERTAALGIRDHYEDTYSADQQELLELKATRKYNHKTYLRTYTWNTGCEDAGVYGISDDTNIGDPLHRLSKHYLVLMDYDRHMKTSYGKHKASEKVRPPCASGIQCRT